jgi:hypothetical protein
MKVGDTVRIHPACDAFMQGMTHGVVKHIDKEWITVTWTLNCGVKRQFRRWHLMDMDGNPFEDWPKDRRSERP